MSLSLHRGFRWPSAPVRKTALRLVGLSWLLAAAVVAGQAEAPRVEAQPHPQGWVTWWLYAPAPGQELATAQPPQGVQDGAALAGFPEQHFKALINAERFVDFRDVAKLNSGVVWAFARIENPAGGDRTLRVDSYCGARVFLDGKPLTELAEPAGAYPDSAAAMFKLPAGGVEVALALKVRRGCCGFALAVYGMGEQKAAAGDRIVLPGVKDSNAAAISALSLQSTSTFVSKLGREQIQAAFLGSVPVLPGKLSLQLIQDGVPQSEPVVCAASELALTPREFFWTAPSEMGASCSVALQLKSGEQLLGKKVLSLFSAEGILQDAQALQLRIAARAKECGHPLPNAALAVEKVLLNLRGAGILKEPDQNPTELSGSYRIAGLSGEKIAGMIENARQWMELEAAGRDPFEGRTGYFERAYCSEIDDGMQPFFVYVPTSYQKEPLSKTPANPKRYPLVVFLHGYVPSYDKHAWWDEAVDFSAVLERQDCLLAIPFGRSNTDFQSCGEVDVLDTIAEMKRLYPVDERRVYLYGYSMGGMAVYTIAGHYPDLFAAGIVMAGRADNPLQNFRPLENFAEYKRWLMQADNPIGLCENFANVPLWIFHGSDDYIINVDEARRMARRLKELGCDARLTVFPRDHFFGFDLLGKDEPVQWLLQHQRPEPLAHERLKTFSLRYARRSGVEVAAAKGDLKPIELEWNRRPDGATEFARDSASVLQRRVGDELIPPVLPGLHKTPRRCGPVREATCGPFTIVVGTTGTPEANEQNRKNAELFAKDWYVFAKSRAREATDKSVVLGDCQSRNLFVFGEEQENSLLKDMGERLPIHVKDGQVTIGEKTVPLAGKGLIFICPNPYNEDGTRSMVVCAGTPYGRAISFNHKLDLVPDFLLYEEATDSDGTSANRAVCAGFFNGEWKVDPAQTWWFDK